MAIFVLISFSRQRLHRFAGELICLNIQPTILQPVQEVSVSHQNVLSEVKGLEFLDVTTTGDVK